MARTKQTARQSTAPMAEFLRQRTAVADARRQLAVAAANSAARISNQLELADSDARTVSKTISRIFKKELPIDKLDWRRSPKPHTHTTKEPSKEGESNEEEEDSKPSAKRQKHHSDEDNVGGGGTTTSRILILLLEKRELVEYMANFLNPFELQAWASCCKAVRGATRTIRLDRLFWEFRILKEFVDPVHAATTTTTAKVAAAAAVTTTANNNNPGGTTTWDDVMKELLKDLSELYKCYGPFQVHPLHASLVGETSMARILKRPLEFDNYLVVGTRNDYFGDYPDFPSHQEELSQDDKAEEEERIRQFPTEPGRVLLQEDRNPFINVFMREDDSHTDQMGLYFPEGHSNFAAANSDSENGDEDDEEDQASNDSGNRPVDGEGDAEMKGLPKPNAKGGDDIPAQIFCMSYFDRCVDGGFSSRREYIDWYHSLRNYGQCSSLAQAWCQYSPLHQDDPWDDWTQLLRAAWLKAHRIAPFDDTEHGLQLWDQVRQAMVEENMKVPETKPTTTEMVIAGADGLPISPRVLDTVSRDRGEARNLAKQCAMVYLYEDHSLAKASDYM